MAEPDFGNLFERLDFKLDSKSLMQSPRSFAATARISQSEQALAEIERLARDLLTPLFLWHQQQRKLPENKGFIPLIIKRAFRDETNEFDERLGSWHTCFRWGGKNVCGILKAEKITESGDIYALFSLFKEDEYGCRAATLSLQQKDNLLQFMASGTVGRLMGCSLSFG